MNFRCSGLLLIAGLVCLDLTSRQAVGLGNPSVIQKAEDTVSATRRTTQNSPSWIAQIPPANQEVSALEPGSQGPQVAELQKTLKLLGYFEDEVTGIYGESTSTAVLKFQKAVNLRGAGAVQVPVAATKTLPSQPKGLPIWIYALGGVTALAGGFTLLRFAQKSSRQPLTAQISAADATNSSPTSLTSKRSEGILTENQPLNYAPNSQVTESSIATPARNHAADLTGTSNQETQPSEPIALHSQEQATGQAHELSIEASAPCSAEQPDLKPAKPANSGIAHGDDTNGHRNLTATVENRSQPSSESALRVTTDTPLSETTRLAKVNIVNELIQELRTPDAVKRHKVIWELSHRGDTRAVQPLVDLMIDSDSKQRSLILSALSEIGTRTLRPMSRALAISLQDDSAEVRKNAIRDLTRVYDMVAQISQLLHQATDDPDTEVQETARWALGQLNRIRSVPDNLPALKNSVSPPENLP